MFSVIFEVHPRPERFDLYLDLAKGLRPILEGIDGFIDNERFESTRRPGWILSHSTWRDEKSVVRWRTVAKHHDTQQRGRDEVFQDYHLRVGEIVADTAPPAGASLVEQRLDETEIGQAKFATLTEVQPQTGVTAAALPDWLRRERDGADLVDYDVLASIYNEGKLVLLASWRDRRAAERFTPAVDVGADQCAIGLCASSGTTACSIGARARNTTRQSVTRPPRGRTIPNLCPSGETKMLELRPNCEYCNKDLPAEPSDAMICSFECTFCRDCTETTLGGRCPNCSGELVSRPIRPAEKLEKYPASTVRVVKQDGCALATA